MLSSPPGAQALELAAHVHKGGREYLLLIGRRLSFRVDVSNKSAFLMQGIYSPPSLLAIQNLKLPLVNTRRHASFSLTKAHRTHISSVYTLC